MPGYNLGIFSEWLDPAATDENIAWTRGTYGALDQFRADRRYVNYFDKDEPNDAVRAAYGPNYERLAELKEAQNDCAEPLERQLLLVQAALQPLLRRRSYFGDAFSAYG